MPFSLACSSLPAFLAQSSLQPHISARASVISNSCFLIHRIFINPQERSRGHRKKGGERERAGQIGGEGHRAITDLIMNTERPGQMRWRGEREREVREKGGEGKRERSHVRNREIELNKRM